MNNNSAQIPLNIDVEGNQPQPDSPRVKGNDQPQPYSHRAMETNDQPDAPPPSGAEEESECGDVYDGELEPISGDESSSPPPPQLRNPTPPPRREEEIMVYNIPIPNQVITIRLPRMAGYPQVEVIHKGDRIRDGLRLLHMVIPKTILITSILMKSENCPHALIPKNYYI